MTNILPVHEAQLMTYMKLVPALQGILLNFFADNIKKSARYYVNDFFKILPAG
ncbi:GxxExxY protein [Pedobacter rhodius]|uniref:GxxExxY protein n=1 Tax=Pedobacter rhodius TaxID=3004098 RepID=UPI003D163E5A